MAPCLFCLRDYERANLTNEHIFLASLGGDLVLERAVCSLCNNGFSRDFEQVIATHFADFRYLLLIPDRYGKIPERRVKVEIGGEQLDAKLLSDGMVQLKPIVKQIRKDGITEIVFQHATERQINELRNKAKKEGSELVEEQVPGQQAEVNISGDLRFIDSPELLRAVTKMAYTALALRMGENFARGGIFDTARNYIRTGTGNPMARLFLHEEYMQSCQQGPHQHSVILAGRNNRQSVDAIVRLFGGLSYLVNFSDSYRGADFFNTLAYDAQRGQENKVLFANEQAELLQIEEVSSSNTTVWNDRVASGSWFLRFLAAAMKAELHD
jgi:hypothetical protein